MRFVVDYRNIFLDKLKGTQAWNNFEILFYLNQILDALGKVSKKISLLFLRFLPEFRSSNIFAVTEHTRNQIVLERYPANFFIQKVHLGPIRWLPKRFFKISISICILIWDFWVIFENYSMRMLSLRRNDLSHTKHTRKRFHRTLSIRGTNFRAYSASGKMWTVLHVQSMLSIRGTNSIAHWAYAEPISSLAEHMRNGFHRWLSIRGNV